MPANNENNALTPDAENLKSATILTAWKMSKLSYDVHCESWFAIRRAFASL
jgi:hypothetical protein